jgi:hypothetical protein
MVVYDGRVEGRPAQVQRVPSFLQRALVAAPEHFPVRGPAEFGDDAFAYREGRSRFRTWLYRIVVKHAPDMRRGRREQRTMTFGCYAHGLDTAPRPRPARSAQRAGRRAPDRVSGALIRTISLD